MTNTYDKSSEQPLREIVITVDPYIHNKGISKHNRKILEQLPDMADDINENFRYLYVNVSQGDKIAVAYQKFKIEDTDLESSDDPDGNPVVRSVLITDGLAQSNHQFDWMMAGGVRPSIVNLGPGRGSPAHPVIIDRDNANQKIAKFEAVGDASIQVSENVCRPYSLDGVRLQFGEWRPSGDVFEFWPSSIAVDSWIYLEQKLPQVVIL